MNRCDSFEGFLNEELERGRFVVSGRETYFVRFGKGQLIVKIFGWNTKVNFRPTNGDELLM